MSLTLHVWEEHREDCSTCKTVEERRRGGRPKNIAGCPRSLVSHIASICGPGYRLSTLTTTDRCKSEVINDLICTSHHTILEEPVQLPCQHLMCKSCYITVLQCTVEYFPCFVVSKSTARQSQLSPFPHSYQ